MAFLQCVFTSIRIVCLPIQIQFQPMRWSKNLIYSALPFCLGSTTLIILSKIWIWKCANSPSINWLFSTNAFMMYLSHALLHLACFVIYCWLQSCLFSEADGIQLCGKEQHLRDAEATPLMTCCCPMPDIPNIFPTSQTSLTWTSFHPDLRFFLYLVFWPDISDGTLYPLNQ